MSQLSDILNLKPSLGTTVDHGNPIAQGLWFNYLFNEFGGNEALDSSGLDSGVLSFTNSIPPATPASYPEWNFAGLSVGGGKGAVRNNKTNKSTFNPVRGSHTIRIVHIPNTLPGGFTALIDVAGTAGSGRILNIFFDTSGNISYRGIGGTDGSATANTVGMQVGVVNDLVWVRSYGDGESGSTHTHYWYLNGVLKHVENGLTGVSWPTDGYDMSLGQNPTGGGTIYNGTYILAQAWDRALSASEVAWLASSPYGIMSDGPIQNFPPDPNATATVGTIGTITLTAPTVTAFQETSNTGTVGTIGTITLTPPTVSGSGSDTGTVSVIGTIVLTPPTVAANAVDNSGIVGTIGVIYLFAPTVFPILQAPPNDYFRHHYIGRFSRGQFVNIPFAPLYITDDVPLVKIWNGTEYMDEFYLPAGDPDDPLFVKRLFLSNLYEDGYYIMVIQFAVDFIEYVEARYFHVTGGVATQPVTSVLEIQRPLGQAVVAFHNNGDTLMGYNPTTGQAVE